MTEPAAPTTGPTTDPADVTDPDEQNPGEHQDDEEHGDTFPRSYVEQLRTESKGHRERAQTAEANLDTVQRELFTVKVAATGKLADPEDLPYSVDLLTDDEALTAAVDELLVKRPHYAARRPAGSVGQGVTGKQDQPFSMMSRLSGV